MFGQMFNVIAPIMIITSIGYMFGRSKFDLNVNTLSTVVILVGLPALIFSSLTSFGVTVSMLTTVSTSALLCLTISGLLSLMVIKLSGLSLRTFLPSLLFPNSGNMGLPLALLAFGDEGLRLAITYFVIVALLQHSLGSAISSGNYNPRSLLKQPLIYSALFVVLVIVTGIQVPDFIQSTTQILGGMMIPVMLLLLGNSLAELKVSDLKPAIVIAIARLAIGLIAGGATIWILNLEGTLAGIVFLLSSMPAAVVSYIYAQRFRDDSEKVAGAVVMSTLLTFGCLPVIIWIVFYIAGV